MTGGRGDIAMRIRDMENGRKEATGSGIKVEATAIKSFVGRRWRIVEGKLSAEMRKGHFTTLEKKRKEAVVTKIKLLVTLCEMLHLK
jgi:hypothetical protein